MTQQRYAAITLIGFYLLMLVGVLMAGCGGNNPPDSTPAIGDAISRAQVRGEAAAEHVVAVQPHTSGTDRWNLDSAVAALVKQASDLIDARKALILANAERANMQERVTRLETLLDEERAQWFGDRTHKWVAWIVGIGVGAWLALGLISTYTGGWFGKFVIHLLPLANPFAWLKARFSK